jgi:hypothetical protein
MNDTELEALKDPNGKGDCFAAAIHLVGANPHAFLVHGIATGNAGEMLGRQGWHAWVELDNPTDDGRETVCIDRSDGQSTRMPRSAYYAALKIEHATRYTYDEAKALWTERQTNGPWLSSTATARLARPDHAIA